MPSHTSITIHDLARLVGTPACPTILDVRIDEDAAADPRLIPSSIRHPHRSVAEAPLPVGRPVVVSCQPGLKLSQGAAALLRSRGIAARSLEGASRLGARPGFPSFPKPRSRPAAPADRPSG